MTYRLTISDDAGRTFSRDISADAALDLIMGEQGAQGGVQDTQDEAMVLPAKKKTGRPHKDATTKQAGAESYYKTFKLKTQSGRFSGHECCGSKGSKHLGTCPMNRKAGKSAGARLVADRKTAFSNGTWSSVKNALDEGDTIDMVVRGKGLDEVEVRRVNLSDTYEEYLTIA